MCQAPAFNLAQPSYCRHLDTEAAHWRQSSISLLSLNKSRQIWYPLILLHYWNHIHLYFYCFRQKIKKSAWVWNSAMLSHVSSIRQSQRRHHKEKLPRVYTSSKNGFKTHWDGRVIYGGMSTCRWPQQVADPAQKAGLQCVWNSPGPGSGGYSKSATSSQSEAAQQLRQPPGKSGTEHPLRPTLIHALFSAEAPSQGPRQAPILAPLEGKPPLQWLTWKAEWCGSSILSH